MPHALLLGDPTAAEMHASSASLAAHLPAHQIRHARDVSELPDSGDWFPDLIVICQTWPDQFHAADVHAVLSRFPLARLVCCYSPWCDSDGRTRNVWPPASRLPAEWAARRIEAELDIVSRTLPASGTLPRPPLPLTAGRDEVFAFDCGDTVPSLKIAEPIAVISPDRAWRDMIARAIRSHKQPGCDKSDDGPQIDAFFSIDAATSRAACRYSTIIYDADPWDASRAAEFQSLKQAQSNATLVAAVGYPRAHLTDELLAARADRVACKLAPLAELFRLVAGI